MSNLMVDIETLGGSPGSVILSIGACWFNAGNLGKTFYQNIDVFDSLIHGFTVDQRTVEWWSKQSNDARCALNKNAHPVEKVLFDFSYMISQEKDVHVWANGPDFDLVILQGAYEKMGMKIPWEFRLARDVRTVMRGRKTHYKTEFIKHNALNDAVRQAWDVLTYFAEDNLKLED